MRKIFYLDGKQNFKHFGEIFKDFLLAINCRTSLFNDENMRILITLCSDCITAAAARCFPVCPLCRESAAGVAFLLRCHSGQS